MRKVTNVDALSFYTSAPNAWLYDRYWGPQLCNLFLAPVEELLLRRLSPGAAVLDLCCGTGRIAQAVAAHGFAVTGLDFALEMLALARVNAPDCRLLRADAREFAFRPTFGGTLSTGNSLNYMLDLADVERVLASVYRSLSPGGIFCFDVLLDDFELPLQTTDRLVEEDMVAVWQETFDPATGFIRGDQILFYRHGDSWQRCDRPYFTQLYSAAEIRAALAAAGFTAVRLFDAQRDLGYALRARTFVVAEKAP